jgi:hypothetical protein
VPLLQNLPLSLVLSPYIYAHIINGKFYSCKAAAFSCALSISLSFSRAHQDRTFRYISSSNLHTYSPPSPVLPLCLRAALSIMKLFIYSQGLLFNDLFLLCQRAKTWYQCMRVSMCFNREEKAKRGSEIDRKIYR